MFTHQIKFSKEIQKYKCMLKPNFDCSELNKDVIFGDFNSNYILNIILEGIIMKVSIPDYLSEVDELIINYILNNFGIYKGFRIKYDIDNDRYVYYFKITNPEILIQLI